MNNHDYYYHPLSGRDQSKSLLGYWKINKRKLLADALALYGSLFFFGYVTFKVLGVLAR